MNSKSLRPRCRTFGSTGNCDGSLMRLRCRIGGAWQLRSVHFWNVGCVDCMRFNGDADRRRFSRWRMNVWSPERIRRLSSRTRANSSAGEIKSETWINSEKLDWASLRGMVVVVDFWTFACYNCKNTLPYKKDWDSKVSRAGARRIRRPHTNYRLKKMSRTCVTQSRITTFNILSQLTATLPVEPLQSMGVAYMVHRGQGRLYPIHACG